MRKMGFVESALLYFLALAVLQEVLGVSRWVSILIVFGVGIAAGIESGVRDK